MIQEARVQGGEEAHQRPGLADGLVVELEVVRKPERGERRREQVDHTPVVVEHRGSLGPLGEALDAEGPPRIVPPS